MQKKYANLLVLPFNEISPLPEFSSPHRFRIQGRDVMWRDGGGGGQTEIFVSNKGWVGLYGSLGYNFNSWCC